MGEGHKLLDITKHRVFPRFPKDEQISGGMKWVTVNFGGRGDFDGNLSLCLEWTKTQIIFEGSFYPSERREKKLGAVAWC